VSRYNRYHHTCELDLMFHVDTDRSLTSEFRQTPEVMSIKKIASLEKLSLRRQTRVKGIKPTISILPRKWVVGSRCVSHTSTVSSLITLVDCHETIHADMLDRSAHHHPFSTTRAWRFHSIPRSPFQAVERDHTQGVSTRSSKPKSSASKFGCYRQSAIRSRKLKTCSISSPSNSLTPSRLRFSQTLSEQHT